MYGSTTTTASSCMSNCSPCDRFARLVLGVSDPAGNYSAAEHGIGPRVLGGNRNAEQRVFDLADKFIGLSKAREVPVLIRQAGLKYLGISVGSEASCMLNPRVCWVANTRTAWAHLLVKHNDNVAKADEVSSCITTRTSRLSAISTTERSPTAMIREMWEQSGPAT